MDENEIKEKYELAKKITAGFDTTHKMEAFKVVFAYLLQGGISKLSQTGTFGADVQEGNDPSDELSVKKKKLSNRCKISVDELDDVAKIEKDNDIELLIPFSGKESEQQILGAQIVLLIYESVLDTEWLSGTILKEILRKASIPDKGGNFAKYMKGRSDLFRSSGTKASTKYTLTSNKGRSSATELLRKFAKGEKIDES